jgi:Na+/glutamate symporter
LAPTNGRFFRYSEAMSHSQNSEHSKPHVAARKPTPIRHFIRLFILNAILYGACAAFIGAIIGDSLPNTQQPKVILALFVVPLVLAIISTILHSNSHRWTSVDDMADRLLHPHQTPRE